ncbi:hypothetical protein ciss_05420 [Carboxydothermus islandicus]|uniref:CRISPR system Cms protein Csm4 n=1 Tax=Carboxydothermus islandicus TaxID=661089 RepID=A0A1L8D0E4_9THEO|nr:hypothetical protein [Carboxydothermus islandicus]GAV24609.1 hypothetical protein ciss_05420 [Carboxydothermus islandicus]
MSWTIYEVSFLVGSPVHIGWKRIGNLWQTRPYIPANQILAALAVRGVELGIGENAEGIENPYAARFQWLKKYFRATYFYPMLCEKDGQCKQGKTVYLPALSKKGLEWQAGTKQISREEFEYTFLNASAHTSIDYELRSAREGSLYQIEYICPRTRSPACQKVYFTGYLFIRDDVIAKEDLARLLEVIYVGGERKYGWGKLINSEVYKVEKNRDNKFEFFDLKKVEIDTTKEEPVITMDADQTIFAHVHLKNGVHEKLKGKVEVLEQRYTEDSGGIKRFGNKIILYPSFMPGSKVKEKIDFLLKPEGIWEG